MGTSAIVLLLLAANSFGATIPKAVAEKQNRVFEQFWGTEFEWKFDELPTSGTVPNFRVPYSGYIYPDRGGGTENVLRKYDLAFHGGRPLAVGFEKWDTTAFKQPTPRKGPFGMSWGQKMETPNWHGHCNGWAAAAIRHAEPKTSVKRNGVTFTPADIKGLLAEIYIYNDVEMLAGIDSKIEPGIFHVIVTNWLGRGGHPLGLEADPSEEKWNYPTYAFSSSSLKRSDRRVEVKLNLAYIKDSNGEYQESPRNRRVKSFHYDLYLNSQGEIIGGNFYADSAIIDMLWLPLRPKQGRQKGNESGNPHIDVNQVLAIWRESASPEEREQWLIVDPAREDRVSNVANVKTLVPLQDPYGTRAAPPIAVSPSPPLPAPPSERSARREAAPTVRAPVTSAEGLHMESPDNATAPRASGASAAAARVPAADPSTLEPTTAVAPSLSDIFRELNSGATATEPAAVTGLLNSPEVPLPEVPAPEGAGDVERNESTSSSDDESAETTADPLFED
jgi:hypothetical protein